MVFILFSHFQSWQCFIAIRLHLDKEDMTFYSADVPPTPDIPPTVDPTVDIPLDNLLANGNTNSSMDMDFSFSELVDFVQSLGEKFCI